MRRRRREKWEERRDEMTKLKHCVWLSHNHREREREKREGRRLGGREGRVTLLGSRNPLKRRRNLIMDRGAAPSEKCWRCGSINKQA